MPIKDEEENILLTSLSQPIWLNLNIKRNGKFFIIEKYCYNGVFFINDIVSEDKTVFVISGISKQIYDKYKFSRLLWYCGCSPREMEKN